MLCLRAKFSSALPVEVDGLAPDLLRGLSASEIGLRPALVGRETVRWGDLFEITGHADDAEITITGDVSRFKLIGRGMTSGRLTVEGHVGLHAGAEMRGGELIIRGNAGDWLGAEMRGGTIQVDGHAGDNAGSAYRGSTKGMRGGTIFISRDVGAEAGTAMRRGLMAIGGSCGAFIGAGMIAGTIVIGGTCGPHPGAGMKRGTLASLSGEVTVPATFRYDCEYRPPIWAMTIRYLRSRNFRVEAGLEHRLLRRHRGDLVALGLGELLIPSAT
ncbi:formylmethanofuran dehydrogenase subunit C [Zavarzinella formosa]|uniref:formylmethanofuran dehydrogenase subunit C n=1 Tax=Zavarzinella formosa TaxID=360055 RepID=UPI0003610650|nr:formylmethanofuran dehydrogenase subunit C [Zavarzinella formosa]